jgi:hypothetical protein
VRLFHQIRKIVREIIIRNCTCQKKSQSPLTCKDSFFRVWISRGWRAVWQRGNILNVRSFSVHRPPTSYWTNYAQISPNASSGKLKAEMTTLAQVIWTFPTFKKRTKLRRMRPIISKWVRLLAQSSNKGLNQLNSRKKTSRSFKNGWIQTTCPIPQLWLIGPLSLSFQTLSFADLTLCVLASSIWQERPDQDHSTVV